MADRQQFTVTLGNNVNVAMPSAVIAGKITDSTSGAVLSDFTGANAIQFPQIVSTLTAAQKRQLVDLLVDFLVNVKTGF